MKVFFLAISYLRPPILFYKMNYLVGRTLADEALYCSTIYPNSSDLGTAHTSLAFGQLRT